MTQGTAFINQWVSTLMRGDLDALAAMCQPDVELSNPDGTFRGAQGVRAAFQPMIVAMSEGTVHITNVIEAGETVVAKFVYRSRHTGPFVTPQGTIPPTQKVTSLPVIGVFELRDGKLAASRGQFDRLSMLAQLGLLPAPVQAS